MFKKIDHKQDEDQIVHVKSHYYVLSKGLLMQLELYQ